MKTASCKAKGRVLQNLVREDLIAALGLDPKLIRCALMGEGGVDIKDVSGKLPIAIECKNVEKLNIHDALLQAAKNTVDGLQACVVFKRNKSKVYAAIEWQFLLFLLINWQELEELKNVHRSSSAGNSDRRDNANESVKDS